MKNDETDVSEVTVSKPVDLQCWMELYGAEISVTCSGGLFSVRVGWKRLLSYNDDRGSHVEEWSISRYDKRMEKALRDATEAAVAISLDSLPNDRVSTSSKAVPDRLRRRKL